MFIAKNFIYVELPKTATTTVNHWLDALVVGKREGKHNKPVKEHFSGQHKFIATIRNPWDWYLSLWSFGCKRRHRSGPYKAFTQWRPFSLAHGFRNNPYSAGLGVTTRFLKGMFYDFKANKDLYADINDPERFRRWLRLILDNRNAWLLSGNYAYSSVSGFSGHLSFSYARLYCKNTDALCSRKLKSIDEFIDWEERNCYIDHFIRVEFLKKDFLLGLNELGYPLSETDFEKQTLSSHRNVSRTRNKLSFYYDPASIDLVEAQEQLIIHKFKYNRSCIFK